MSRARGHTAGLLTVLLLPAGLTVHAATRPVREPWAIGRAIAPQESLALQDSLRQVQIMQLSPHVLWFDPTHTSATLEFRNPSDHLQQAVVMVQFVRLDEPHGLPLDTMIIETMAEDILPHDTVIAAPGVADRYAGRWLSGVPAQVTLAPHQAKRVTIRFAPPAHLPAGEYWARIVTLVRPDDPYHPGGQDVQQRYALPTKGHALLLQDTCLVVYRQGPLHMGVAIGAGAAVQLDSAHSSPQDNGVQWDHPLWLRLPVHLTGNVPFRGMLHSQFRNVETGEVVNPNRFELLVMHDAVLHFKVDTHTLGPGVWDYTLTLDNQRPEIPVSQRVPMTPVRRTFRFTVLPAYDY